MAIRKSAAISDDRLLTALLGSPSSAVIATDADGLITRWSAGAQQLYGWTEQEMLGQPGLRLVPPHRVDDLQGVRDALRQGKDVPSFEFCCLDRDGAEIDVEISVLVVRDEQGQPAGSLALHRDVRPARRAREALWATAEELRARFRDSLVPQGRTDLEGRILAANAALAELLGRPECDLVGMNAVQLYSEQDQPAVVEALGRLLSGEVTQLAQEHTMLRGDGTPLRIVTSVSVMQDPSGKPQLAASLEDVTALREAEKEARDQAERFDILLQSMPVAVFSYDVDGRCRWARGQGLAAAGIDGEHLVGTSLLELYDDENVREAMLESLAGREGGAVLDLADRVYKCHYRPLLDEEGVVRGGLGVALDVTQLASAEREVRANEARLHALLRHASDVVTVMDEEGRLIYVSPAVRTLFGYEERHILWRPALSLNHPDDRSRLRAGWERVLAEPGATQVLECRARHADGSWRWTEQSVTNLLHDPAIQGVVANIRDVTEQRRVQAELQRLALHDGLTGVANRALLLDRIGQALVRARRAETQIGLVLLDVVGLQAVNERLGHDAGDLLLRTAAERLQESARATDSVARAGGGAFAVLVDDVASTEALRARAATLVDAVRGPVELGETAVDLELRAGTALSPAVDAGGLLAAAERAMPRAGERTRVVVAQALSPDEGGRAARTAADALRRAIVRGELRVHYQPVVGLVDGLLQGTEALVRWQHGARGLLAPAEFVPLAESSGVVVELGEWVLREACTRAAQWQQAGSAFTVGVNLSPRQMLGGHFVELVREVLADTGARPDLLVLEVTESAVMDDPGATDVLHALRGLGVRLALDDFGTGYSSLTYLKRFPVDAIKVDRSFVAGLGRDPDDEAIVASVVSLARSVGKLVTAEGVETAGQLSVLRGLGVDQAQGFLFSPPLPAEQLDSWVADWRPSVVADAAFAVRPVQVSPEAAPPAAVGSDEERILELHSEGASLHTIAAALNAEGRRTPAGPRWTTKTVARVVAAAARTT